MYTIAIPSSPLRSPLLLLLRAYSTLKLASFGNFDFYAEGFRAIARALPKLEETWLPTVLG